MILSFVPVMAVAAGATWRRADDVQDDETGDCPPIRPVRVVLSGTGIGLLTGFFGVGGGFLIVPALTLGLAMTFRRAVATSLVIITLTGLVALTGHLVAGAQLNVAVTVSLAAATGSGALIGTAVGQRMPQAALGKAFATVVAVLAAFLLVDTLLLGGPPQ